MATELPRVLPDTNVCYPISLLDLMLRCDEHDLHRVVWTDDLLDELVRVWIRNGARSKRSATAIVRQIAETFPDQHVGRDDYQHLIPTMPGADPDDHVHAAAAASIAPSIILTANTKDFPAMHLAALGVTVVHPDAYFHELLDAVPDEIHAVLAEMSKSRRRPPTSVLEVVGALERAGLQAFAQRFRGE